MSKLAGLDALLAVILNKTLGIFLHSHIAVHVLACGGIFHTIIPVHGAFCVAADFILCVYLFQCLNNSRPFQRVGLHRIKATQHHQKKTQKLNQRQKLVQRQEVLPIHRLVQNLHCSQQSPAWQDDPRCHRNHALLLVLVRSSSGQLLSPALGASGCCLCGLRRRLPWPHLEQKLNGEGQVLQCLALDLTSIFFTSFCPNSNIK